MRFFRLLKIIFVVLRFGLDEFLLAHERTRWMRVLVRVILFFRSNATPRAVRLRLALEALGPIFVKFGQMLSTRRDLMPTDIADELAKLQDQVPPFPSQQAVAVLEKLYQKKLGDVFASFDETPVASASVAQVHFAVLPDGREAAVKILRPGIQHVIEHDLALLDICAGLIERWWADGKRLKPKLVVAEFEKYLHDELDLMREASNASELKRNFAKSDLLIVPEIYWDWCSEQVMVMERMHGIPISQIADLRAAGVDLSRLAASGVEIFYTQVFRDGFFHADMHPGNIFVARDGRYIALDFGIMGTLTDTDKHYLAQNFIAFFRRDYKRVAEVHIESGWAPANTRVDELEAAIRAVCEPIFDKPLREVSFGKRAAAPVPDVAPLRHRDPAAAGVAAKDIAQHRGVGSAARSRTRSVEDRQALAGALDERTGRLARFLQGFAQGSTATTPPSCRSCRACCMRVWSASQSPAATPKSCINCCVNNGATIVCCR